ncbi:MAG: hypothetical protein JWM32_2222 [Verrucomicrobia bacterium]|nr:hypothetical protein [Verrucomicrobiota bacterium]
MDSTPPASTGLLHALRSFGDGILGSIEDRLSLLAVELQEEKFRLIQIFIWISAAVFTGMLAITFASLAIVYLFWDTARLAVLVGFTVIYFGALAAIVISFRRYIARQPKPFAATLTELKEDRECIRQES